MMMVAMMMMMMMGITTSAITISSWDDVRCHYEARGHRRMQIELDVVDQRTDRQTGS